MYTFFPFLRIMLVATSLYSGTPNTFGPFAAVQKMSVAELADYIAKCDHPLVVNFWATYCTPCLTEIPYMQKTVAEFNEQQVELILVSMDAEADYPVRIAGFAGKKGFTARLIWLSGKSSGDMRSRVDSHWSGGLPSTLFCNNALGYRRFFDRQMTNLQVAPAIKEMLK